MFMRVGSLIIFLFLAMSASLSWPPLHLRPDQFQGWLPNVLYAGCLALSVAGCFSIRAAWSAFLALFVLALYIGTVMFL